jgi:hypothetical protein
MVFIGAPAPRSVGDAGLASPGKAWGLAIVSGGSAGKSGRVGGTIGRMAAVVLVALGSGLNICVGGGSGSRREAGDLPTCGSKGAERIAPSSKQKVRVSSKVRLHVGQLFIIFEEDVLFKNDEDQVASRM